VKKGDSEKSVRRRRKAPERKEMRGRKKRRKGREKGENMNEGMYGTGRLLSGDESQLMVAASATYGDIKTGAPASWRYSQLCLKASLWQASLI